MYLNTGMNEPNFLEIEKYELKCTYTGYKYISIITHSLNTNTHTLTHPHTHTHTHTHTLLHTFTYSVSAQ